jgi:hypothetical protein
MYATIQPLSYRQGNATILSITQTSVDLSRGAAVSWSLMNEDRTVLFEHGTSLLGGEEYSSWLGDDEYVMRWLAEKLSVTIVEIHT